MVVFVLEGLFAVAMTVLAWKYWRGEWLRSIAGNTFADEEEMRDPHQLALGRRAAVVCLTCAVCAAALIASTGIAETVFGTGSSESDLLIRASTYVSLAVIVAACAILFAVQWRERCARERAKRTGGPRLEEDTKMEARQAIAIIAIVVVLEIALPFVALRIL